MIRDDLAAAVTSSLERIGVSVAEPVSIERPARAEHGDWSTNIALVSAKAAGRNPRELAGELAADLDAAPPAHVERVEIAGPGFVNFHLAPSWLHDVLTEVVTDGVEGYARPDLGNGRHINVEFVSANPTGPVHAGHARGAAHGDSLARLLERCGHKVTREFYVNDRGAQMRRFAESLAARRDGREPPTDGYHGDYIIAWAADMPTGVDPLEWGEQRALADQAAVLADFGVRFDHWFSEASMVGSGAIDDTLADLRDRGVAYDAEGATWLRSSDFGDDKDRVLVRSNGEPTYLLPDIAYHRDKFSRADALIDVWGADHHGYVSRMRAAMAALGHDADELETEITQLVDLLDEGRPLKLSKRAGTVVELGDLIGLAGADATRFTYLLQSVDTRQTVDVAVVTRQAMDNPVFYVQMANARLAGIVRRAAETGVARRPLAEVDLGVLAEHRELEALRRLAELGDVVALACAERAPHKITTWTRDLATAIHGFYHDCYVISETTPAQVTQARLWLVAAAQVGLAIGLDLLGVAAPESM